MFHLCHKRKHTHIQLHCGEACLHYRLHIATLRTQKNKNDAWHCQICPLSFKLSIFCNCRRLICWGQRSLLVQHSFSPCVRMIPTLKELGLTFHFIMIINVNMVNFKQVQTGIYVMYTPFSNKSNSSHRDISNWWVVIQLNVFSKKILHHCWINE